jgi:hypothetical protein
MTTTQITRTELALHMVSDRRARPARSGMTDTQALIGVLAALALVPVVIACALVATRRDP